MKPFIFALALLATQSVFAQDFNNLGISAAIDAVTPIYIQSAGENKMGIRGAELSLYGPLDPFFDGKLTMAAHDENGEQFFELHEAYIQSARLLPSLRAKVGRFFLGVGRLNQLHQHDWPFITAPRSHAQFFDKEGVADSGLELAYLLPANRFWEIQFGVTNGYTYGHTHSAGQRPHIPTHYIHPTTYWELSETTGLQLGLNYLGRTSFDKYQNQIFGFDLTFKDRDGKTLAWLVQSEFYYRKLSHPVEKTQEFVGGYVYPEKGFDERNSLGVRFDLFSETSRTFLTTSDRRKNLHYALAPTYTFRSSEFAKWRVAYTYQADTQQGDVDDIEQKVELQFTLILGDHPAHDF